MNQEILACIKNEHIKFLQSGQISKYIFPMPRKEAHQKKITHIIVRFFVMTINPKNEVLYLVQKRGKNKEVFPKYYSDSASGHVIYENKLNLNNIKENALRELEEEFGIPPKDIQSIIFHDLEKEKDGLTTEIAYIFFGLVEYNVKLQPDPKELEIDGSRFYDKIELEKLFEEEQSVDYSKKIWEKLFEEDIKSLFEFRNHLNETEQDIALFIGRYQPLHHGHIYVLRRILELCRVLKIGVGSSQLSNHKNDPFTGEERTKFLKAALRKRKISQKKYEIHEIPDIFNAKKWIDHVISIVGEFNIVYTNSSWVRQLFQNRGIRVGKKIEIFKNKFNGTNIRNLIIKNKKWTTLVPNEVVELMREFKGIERIKSLSKNS